MELDFIKLKPIKPTLYGYVREAGVLLRKEEVPGEDAVHDIRVLMKRARALLKLTSSQMENGMNERDIIDLRDVGRIMCRWRESSVHRKTLKSFRKSYPEIFSRLTHNSVLTQMLEKTEPSTELTPEMKEDIELITTKLSKTGYRLRFRPMKTVDPRLLLTELNVSYSKVSDVYLKCRNNPQSDTLHNFRKKSKDFLYQLYIFRPVNPPVIKNLEKKLDDLTGNLGKYNDISQIIKEVGYEYQSESSDPALDELILKFRDAQDRYLMKVWPVAYDIFCPGQKLLNILGFKLLMI